MNVIAKTPMMKQYFEIKSQYKDYILFYRLGDFYEMFYDDAVIASKELEITLTKRATGNNESAPLCGVPFHSSENYIAKLIKKGYKVAICEQVEDAKNVKGIVKREVVKIITPGTVNDLELLESNSNSYLCSIYIEDNSYCIAYTDISTLSMYAIEFNNLKSLIDEIGLLEPVEVILEARDLVGNYNYNDLNLLKNININEIIKNEEILEIVDVLNKLNILITWKDNSYFEYNYCVKTIKRIFNIYDINVLDFDDKIGIVGSIGALFQYIEDTQKNNLTNFQVVKQIKKNDFMIIDNFTRTNLELIHSYNRNNKKGTLLWVINKTKTAMGARMLKNWLEKPLIDENIINERLNFVEFFYNENTENIRLREYLGRIYDFERIISKVIFKNANPRDLVTLKNSIEILPKIRELLSSHLYNCEIKTFLNEYDDLIDIYEILDVALSNDAPMSMRDGDIFNLGYNKTVDEYRDILKNGNLWIKKIEAEEREKTGIKNLKISFNKSFGYYIEITKSQIKNVPINYIRKQTLVNAERFITEELKHIEDKMFGAEDKLKKLEYELFVELRDNVEKAVNRIKNMAVKIAYIDVISNLAYVAEENNYVKPKFNNLEIIDIQNARHPVVEKIENLEEFISNSTHIYDKELLQIITGPNMAGKSTYLRQVALITILSQIGSFVPAESANLSIVDRVFTRVGASDDLFNSKSTFMVEMNELAIILNSATKKSLIILDEIGRGTSTYDGLSIAWAVVEYIARNIKAKTLFATHYHELSELEGKIEGVSNYRISVKNTEKGIVFLRKIIRGSANQSLGIEVAKLAGVPKVVIDRANDILLKLEKNDISKEIDFIVNDVDSIDRKNYKINSDNQLQLSIVDDKIYEISNIIEKLNISSDEILIILNKYAKLKEIFLE